MNKVRDGILGLVVGDALGVPVEFQSRAELERNPVTDMRGYGTYYQPKGTWSDDSSLALALADSLKNGYDLEDIARKFVSWRYEATWTPHGEVFDIGNTTAESLQMLKKILESGDPADLEWMKHRGDEHSNGNGALMRILPLYFYLHDKSPEQQSDIIWDVSGLTHGHIRSALACSIYLVMADEIVKGRDLQEAYARTRRRAADIFLKNRVPEQEQRHFRRIVALDISEASRNAIYSAGYVIYSLEAAFWSLLNSNSYEETVLTAVNLGEDTDTNAAIAGGLAGLYYGAERIPSSWLQSIVRLEEIEQLCNELNEIYPVKPLF